MIDMIVVLIVIAVVFLKNHFLSQQEKQNDNQVYCQVSFHMQGICLGISA